MNVLLNKSIWGMIVASGLVLQSSVNAGITYVDAVEGSGGNTFEVGGSLADTSWLLDPGGVAVDEDQWQKRTGFATWQNADTGYMAAHDATTNEMPVLTTQVTGLAPGAYTMWAFFWDHNAGSNRWGLAAGLDAGSLTTYYATGDGAFYNPPTDVEATNAATLSFTNAPNTADPTGAFTMWGAELGVVNVDGSGVASVFIHNEIGGDFTTRSWYDGIGYELVPEPASLALLGLGGLMMLRRRRV